MNFPLTIYLAVAVGLCYIIIYLIWVCVASPGRAIPGPWASRFTRLWYYRGIRAGSFHHENIALHEKYGPIVRVAPGFYSITTPDKSVYGIGSKFPKGEWYKGWQHPTSTRWTLFPDQNIRRHAETRKRFQGLYSMSSLLSYEIYVDECIDVFLDKLGNFARSGTTVDLVHWFQCYAFDVIGEITYSERFGFLDNGDDIAGTMAALDKSMVYSTLVGVFPEWHPTIYAIMEKIPGSGAAGRTYLMNFVQKKVDERERAEKKAAQKTTAHISEDSVAPQDFLDKLMDAQKQNPEKVTSDHVYMMGLSNIIAGSDTTAVSLSSITYYLITSPRILSKLRQEIKEHGLWHKRITFKDSQEMPYLQAVLKEGLRMHPATGLPLWRVVPEGGWQVGEHWLPPGTNVGLNSWVAHYDKSVFGDDAHTFRPERWEEAKQEGGERYRKMEANYMPFGLGSRTCLGRHISTLEMSKLIPEIVKNFDLTLGMQKEQWKTINYWFVKPEKLPVAVNRHINAGNGNMEH
ncbi:cytochrome P450 CYP5080B3 [Cucurbitaria berberidis CBS 394.84]|uniref:Cytochrome P450 CYP5080B3 n=1 Tax=Cucurbitaria berberidis CBS 394.84 TaxID=1168544 RepID=A0A9P4L488_9PLEO|nr:cytochrome P450 CYP5080B3 [Cucurbitaria berberidis CBS 394.84]KAF1841205.1 cytochrome P450 CYP5080B3 [Cucurbitaria berberidis CBS 394.84]